MHDVSVTSTTSRGSSRALLHIIDAAAELRIPITAAQELVDTGALASTSILNRTYIPAAAIDDYIDSIRGNRILAGITAKAAQR